MNNLLVALKWLLLSFLDLLLVPVWYLGAPIVSCFTKQMLDLPPFKWGGWFGTYDNPTQGDSRWLREGFFPGITTGFKGYLNRIGWLWRNPGYGFNKFVGIPYGANAGQSTEISLVTRYSPNCSPDAKPTDKYARSGWYFTTYKEDGKLKAFEFYLVHQYLPTKCFRAKLGWKITTHKFKDYGFGDLVNTIHIYKEFGEGLRK